jgi:methylmalonyl-CoA mutase, C-terminal domain
LIAKLGLDGHDRGAKLLCRFLRDAGMEVIYTGLRQTPGMVAKIALQEDVDFIGISILSRSHNHLLPLLMNEIKLHGLDTPVLVGGIIPEKDIIFLSNIGVEKVYLPGTLLELIRRDIEEIYAKRI